jgi:DNA-binding CsgD family transcriptional regulator
MTAPASPARLMAETLTMLKRLGVTDRAVFDGILRTTLESHPRYLCVWSIWEPNALDGRDRDYVNRRGHDVTGRYIPLWHRGRGAIALEANVHYETPGVGDFYLRPRRELRESVIDPYDYPIAGAHHLITSQSAPVFFAGRCVGAAGIDIAVAEIPAAADPGGAEVGEADNAVERLLNRGFVFFDRARAGTAAGGRVSYCSGRSRRLLERFVGPAPRGQLPARLRRLLAGFGSAAHAAPPAGGLTFSDGAASLLVTPFDHPSTGPGLLLAQAAGPTPPPLSARERQVLDWMAAGKTNGEIASILGISLHTVKRHVEKVLQKLRVPNRNAAVEAARPIGPSTYPAAHRDDLAC